MSLRRQDHLMILSPGPLRAPVRLLSSNTGQSPLLGLSSSPPPLSSSGSFSLFFSLSFNFLLAVRHFLLARSHGTYLTLYTHRVLRITRSFPHLLQLLDSQTQRRTLSLICSTHPSVLLPVSNASSSTFARKKRFRFLN